jgi:hypothetical protein
MPLGGFDKRKGPPVALFVLSFPQQLRQLRDIRRDPARLIHS